MTIATRGQGFLGEPCDTQNIPATSASNELQNESTELDFPHDKLLSLDEKISNVRWVVPVLPDQELECLLNASVDLAKKGVDTQSEACQRFFREGLTISFTKILTDDAVSSWKSNIHLCIFQNCLKLVELCVVKLKQDWFPLLDLLAMLFNPNNKFHTFNASRASETAGSNTNLSEEELFARPSNDIRNPRGWLVDLINKFGELGGFQLLLERFQSGNLSVSVVFAFIRPFGLSYEFLTPHTINKYILPVLDMIPNILEKLTDDELKREAKSETKSDIVSAIIKSSKNLASRVPNQEELIRVLESFRLKMILRQLQISSFNGKMNALNEINKVISSVAYYPNRHHGMEEEEYLTPERMAKWLKENQVLEIVLRDSLHQPQYVEKLEKILRFVIKEHALTLSDLDAIWSAQVGKHEAIVKNVHDLLAKLAWDFSPEQLDHLFECFQSSWTSASKRQRERLLELIRRLAEDDKEGVMAHKVLTLFWNLAHSEEVPTEIMDQALAAHVKILDYSCSQERDAQKTVWLDKCVDELKQGDSWALPALKQIREISCLYEPNVNGMHTQRTNHTFYRQEVIERLQTQHSLVILVTNSLTSYMERLRVLAKEHPDLNPETHLPDGRYNHNLQVQERLNFLRFLLKDGQLWLCAEQAKQIWNCLTENAIFPSDREACFRWFSKLMGEEPDLDPGINKDFFENNILQLDPVLLTESGIKCFERFFKAVNVKEDKLKPKRRTLLTEDPDLIGLDYLWKVVTLCSDEVAARAIELLREVTTNLGPSLQATQLEFHEQFITECFNRLRAYYDTVLALQQSSVDKEFEIKQIHNRIKSEAVKMCRVLRVLYEYINECDSAFMGERRILPLHRACRGKHMTLIIRFSSPSRQVDDLEIFTHSNETLASLRRHILRKIKPGVHCKLELFVNGEPLDSSDDRKLLSQIPLRDKMFISAKVSQINSNIASSQDSSSDSSTSSPQHPYDGPNIEAENLLPGVLMSMQTPYAYFFCQLAALGSVMDYPPLRDGARLLLQIMPCDNRTIQKLLLLFTGSKDPEVSIESTFFRASPAEVLYNLEVLYVLLMPAQEPLSDKSYEFQYSFIISGEAHTFLDFLIKNNFMSNADIVTLRSAFLIVLKICKLILTSVAHVLVRLSEDHTPPETESRNDNVMTPGMYLKQALRSVPGHSDSILRQVSMKLSQGLADLMLSETNTGHTQALFNQALNWEFPDTNVVLAIMRLVWAASSANLHARDAGPETLHSLCNPAKRNAPLELHVDDALLCKEALELLSIALVLNPSSLEHLCREKMFLDFLTDLVLFNPSSAVRISAAEQFLVICTCGAASKLALQLVTPFLFSLLDTLVVENTQTSHEFFQLLCRLVNFSYIAHVPLPAVENLVGREVAWLRKARNQHDVLLEGHLSLGRELLSFMTTEQKCELGSSDTGSFIKELLEDFLFPASKLMLQLGRTGQLGEDPATPICDTPQTQAAAFELLCSLCVTCVLNCKQLVAMLNDMFYSDPDSAIIEWDYFPAVGPRPFQGFVGLKNAGATCYMNSVLQQLYMVESIREGLLAAEGAATDPNEDFSGEDRLDIDSECCCDDRIGPDNNRKDYNVGILKQVQAIFGHLAYSRLQYYVPKGLWKHFKLQGEPVNLREQQDAVEFFMSLVESLDEALKTLGHEQIMSKILGGSYSDQKICKGCPHRYSKEEPFSVISVDIRNHSSLQDSMEQYVKGELLEGADAYYCEKCAKKVETVKRLCVKKLPPILTIQLKRFEYDFERVCAIKFNDYFEFPRDLDMEPYTVSGLAKLEGEIVDCDLDTSTTDTCTKYRLSGIVVHSGQASGGHYYSYIRNCDPSGKIRWYKFDDGDVSECRMGEDEEMKIQCFGGDYMGEVFDPMLKRTTYRRQKRWWNAYMLFYTRMDVEEQTFLKSMEMLSLSSKKEKYVKMPLAIENSIRKQNIKFLHHRSQFSIEYFSFIRKLMTCTTPTSSRANINTESEQLSLLCTQLASKFLFHSGWHTKKNLRGPAIEWCDILCLHLRASPMTRSWFAHEMLFSHPHRFCEYLLSCPSNEIRSAFTKIIVLLAHFSNNDGPCAPPPGFNNPDPSATLSDHLLLALLSLLQREVSEHGRHLPHYCNVFHMYASQGIHEKTQLLKMNVPATFMLVAMDEGPGPAIKYQYIELGKLHQLVSCLVRCCDVSSKCQSSTGNPVLPNPYREPTIPDYIMPLHPQALEILFGRTIYIKKVIEDTNISEDAIKLLQFCCWENPHFSRIILSELLWQIAFAYCQELRHHMELLLSILLIEDSWQTHRIHNAIKGVPEEREGLLETIARSKNHYQKRAYQCIKCMVALFSKCRPALAMLHGHADLRRQWTQAVAWLQDELERRYPANSQYSYNTWSPPAQSNDNSNGYFLERSNSARKTFERAIELMPEPDREEEDASEEQESQEEITEASQGEENNKTEMPDVTQSCEGNNPPPPQQQQHNS